MRLFLSSAFVLSTIFVSDEPKPVSVKTIQTIQQSIVGVVCARPNGTIKKVIASGFLINRQGHFVTAGHVIKTGWDTVQTKDDPCNPAIFEPSDPWKVHIKGRALAVFLFSGCQYGDSIDIAVCKTIDNPFLHKIKTNIKPAILYSPVELPDGTAVGFTGFPLGLLFPVTSKGYVAGYAPFSERLVIDKSAWLGASGSPVYEGNGNVIGMITDAGINYGSGLAYALPARSILNFLSEQKIATEK